MSKRQEACGKSLHLPFNFAMNLKLFLKKESLDKSKAKQAQLLPGLNFFIISYIDVNTFCTWHPS